MKLTNKYNLSEVFINLLKDDNQNLRDNEISVTTLINPVLQYYLRKKYDEQIEVDVSEQLWAILGKAVHGVLERYGGHRIVEKQFSIDIDGITLYGTIDAYDPEKKILEDYKVTSVYAMQGDKEEWTKQLNCYAYLLEKNGYEVREAYIYALLRDWSHSIYDKNKDKYPAIPFIERKIDLWKTEDTEKYIVERVEKFKKANKGIVEICSSEEKWNRNGKNIRCLFYCPVRGVCDYAKDEY